MICKAEQKIRVAPEVEEQGLCSAPEDRKGEAGVAKFGDQQDFPYIM